MIYHNLFEQTGDRRIRTGIIGTGTYGISLISQAQSISRLEIAAVCDQDPESAQRACRQAGIPEEKFTICSNRKELLLALDKGKCAVVEDYTLLADVPLDVIVECTGNPEAGARHAEFAIHHGKHVAMVNKETDSVIGPLLHQFAASAGVIYTPVDGDQHGLLIGLFSWARSLGLDVVCGGKARPDDFVYDEKAATVANGLKTLTLSAEEMEVLRIIQGEETGSLINNRRKIFKELPQIAEADMCESVIAANATGLLPDIPSLHAPVVRTTEIADVLCPVEAGGILNTKGAIEAVTCLRRSDEAGLGGGVFIVFSCNNDAAWNFVKAKGLLSNRRGTVGLVYRPFHLLGAETPITLLCAGLLKISTGSLRYEPLVDLIARTTCDLSAGSTLQPGRENSGHQFEPLIFSSASVEGSNPLPLYLAVGNRVKVDVPAGEILTCEMFEAPADSRLWNLRMIQDKTFEGKAILKKYEGNNL